MVTALMPPDEAMRRLRQLTMRRSVSRTRVTLVVTGNELMVLDGDTNAVVERFPLSLVCRPTAVSSESPGDVYDNVVVLVVLGDTQQQLPPEVHIFQCLKNPVNITTTTITCTRYSHTSLGAYCLRCGYM